MYDHSLDHGFIRFCCCLHAFITEEMLKCHSKGCFEFDGKKQLKCIRKVKMLNWKILKEK